MKSKPAGKRKSAVKVRLSGEENADQVASAVATALGGEAPQRKPCVRVTEAVTDVVDRVRAGLRRAVFTPVPFAAVKVNGTFWWRGACFIKESDARMFGEIAPGRYGPMTVPFGPEQTVEI